MLGAAADPSDGPMLSEIATSVLLSLELHELAAAEARGWMIAALTALVSRRVFKSSTSVVSRAADEQEQLQSMLERLILWFRDAALSAAVCEQSARAIHAICKCLPHLIPVAAPALQSALLILQQDVSISTMGALCKLVGVLVTDRPQSQLLVVQQGGVQVLLSVLQLDTAIPSELKLLCCDALCKVCASSIEASEQVTDVLNLICVAMNQIESAAVTARACDVATVVAAAQRDLSGEWPEVCQALVAAMKQHPQCEAVQVAAIAAMAAIAAAEDKCNESSAGVLSVMSDSGALAVVLSAMRAFETLVEVQIVSANAIAKFSMSQHHKKWLGAHGAIDLLIQSMHRSLWKERLQVCGLEALQALTTDCKPNVELASKGGVLQQVLWSVQVHASSQKAVALFGCRILCQLVQCEELAAEMVADEIALNSVISCMKAHPNSAGVQEHSSHALAVLVKASPELQNLVLEKEALTCVTAASTAHLGVADTSAQLMLAFAALSSGCDKNRVRLVEEGALGTSVAAMQVHSNSVVVQQAGCVALAEITASDPTAQEEAMEHGAVEVVLATLDSHQTHSDVVRECCVALSKLCVDCTSAANLALEYLAPQLLLTVLDRFMQSPEVLRDALAVLRILSSNSRSAGAHSFAQAHGFNPLLQTLRLHCSDHAVMIEACGLICNVTRGESIIELLLLD